MDLSRQSFIDKALICSITPYFLEKGNFWIEKNLRKILEAKKTQSFFEDNTLYLEKNQKVNLSQILRKLDEMGYEKMLQVQEPGEFSQRGGIIDVFPINLNFAIRFEFLGNKIENIERLPIEIRDEKKSKEILKKKLKSQKLFSDLKGLKAGDYLVHLDHGVGRFMGFSYMVSGMPYAGKEKSQHTKYDIPYTKYYVLEYAAGDKLYVPLGLERKLSRYVGFVEPKISRLGSGIWQRTKRKVKEETEKLAKELLEIYAKREITTRSPYLTDDELDYQIASTFQYEETPDQIQAIEDIKRDLETEQPMDRIVCGDVGFGKTEVALRTMIKAIRSGYQTAMICPTTILANQHFQNFKERLQSSSDLPIRIAILSRLQPKKEQKEIVENLKTGKIDIVVGTHRILSTDVEFKNLGLLIIDDEQRFGVKQKEKLKKLRTSLDVLSLSATPIPRTLYLALSSLKNISLIQTPPVGRLPVKTKICPWSETIIREAIEKEISRGGQIYYLHNRVETIGIAKGFLQKIVPKAKFGIAHGRLKDKELVMVMADFRNKKFDVLIATTIIENGLDLPNVNTLIVADATRLGLAEAYQIRGRIGRSHIQAFAYFLYGDHLTDKAKMRLDALKEAEELGSGYRIALKDLEIRGAGNILGKEQSGNINQVGLNLYCQMLSEAIEKIKNK
jgi:transcription-repair coupling factor (superfamily II helicase)